METSPQAPERGMQVFHFSEKEGRSWLTAIFLMENEEIGWGRRGGRVFFFEKVNALQTLLSRLVNGEVHRRSVSETPPFVDRDGPLKKYMTSPRTAVPL